MVTRDKWVTASRVSRTNKPGRNKSYVHGFHAFATRRSAIGAARGSFGNHSTVRKVFLAGVHTKGKQYGDKHCYVANKMYVPLLTTKPPKVPSAKTSAVRRASSKR